MKRFLMIGFLVLAACENKAADVKTEEKPVAADNTKKNERDKGNTTTPTDQAENATDRNITKDIRAALMKKDDLSVNAKNVKVVTNDGNVTLRGPVADEKEKTTIVAAVTEVAGVKKVDNQLEVAAK